MCRIAHIFYFVLLITGCGGFSHSSSLGNLDLRLQVDQQRGEVGKPVTITFTVTKYQAENYDMGAIDAGENPVMDIVIGNYAKWSAEQASENVLHRLELKPGESKRIQMTWMPDQRAERQVVLIQGIVQGQGNLWQDTQIQLPIGQTLYK